MKISELYPLIFKRKSVRNYNQTPLNEDTLKDIKEHLNSLLPLYEDIKTEFKIISTEDVNQRMMKRVPHYIAIFSEVKEGYLTNVGFMIQQMDLYLSANGIGSCWQGIPTIKKEVAKSTALKFIILLAFGKAEENLHRSDVSEFKRKPLKEISSVTGALELMEAVRLAPSATNFQGWFFTGDENRINAYSVKAGFLRKMMSGKYIPIDLGIALCHLTIALEHFGKNATLVWDETARKNPPKETEYVVSLKIK